MKPTQEQITAAETVFLAMAHAQIVGEAIGKVEQSLLDKFQYKWDIDKVCGANGNKRDFEEFVQSHGEYCKREFDTYLISDKDFGHYLTEKHAILKANNFDVEFGYCPKLIAESLQRDAERELIKAMEPVTKISLDKATYNLANYKKLIDLSLRFIAPFVSSKQILATL